VTLASCLRTVSGVLIESSILCLVGICMKLISAATFEDRSSWRRKMYLQNPKSHTVVAQPTDAAVAAELNKGHGARSTPQAEPPPPVNGATSSASSSETALHDAMEAGILGFYRLEALVTRR
jgi:hypothetical protein